MARGFGLRDAHGVCDPRQLPSVSLPIPLHQGGLAGELLRLFPGSPDIITNDPQQLKILA